jgi:hypothetical protein
MSYYYYYYYYYYYFINTNLKTNFVSTSLNYPTMVVHTSHHRYNDMTAVLLEKIIASYASL